MQPFGACYLSLSDAARFGRNVHWACVQDPPGDYKAKFMMKKKM